MSKFTKGNWEADDFGEYVFTRAPEGLEPIAQMRGWSYLTGIAGLNLTAEQAIEVQKANARLIAAAPEMYRILVKVLDDTQNGQHASENELIALLNAIDGENREFNYMYPTP